MKKAKLSKTEQSIICASFATLVQILKALDKTDIDGKKLVREFLEDYILYRAIFEEHSSDLNFD